MCRYHWPSPTLVQAGPPNMECQLLGGSAPSGPRPSAKWKRARAALSGSAARASRNHGCSLEQWSKDEFLATLSHELRTPMTAVVGWSRMLKMGLGEEESKEAIDAIEKSASVQTQLIDDILDMSRIMSGRLRIDAHPVDFRVINIIVIRLVTTIRHVFIHIISNWIFTYTGMTKTGH
ncbi:histidine kinase dimerization/phospho-acceptor domain-containing protein [Acidovorax sp. BLS4]|nr:histidine kinase dimerization/phospho-acceptor domain-containing protein [Paracidovorax avenae]WOI45620.1 histidine kinase dimerization/phospho-acceptor domain-containing protein [Paracidovorax avenae]